MNFSSTLFAFLCLSMLCNGANKDSLNEKNTPKEKFSIGFKTGVQQSYIKWHTPPNTLQACSYLQNKKTTNQTIFGLQGTWRFHKNFLLQTEVYFGKRGCSLSFLKEDASGNRKNATDYIYKYQQVDFDLLLKYQSNNEKMFFFSTMGLFYSNKFNIVRTLNEYWISCLPDGTVAPGNVSEAIYSNDDSQNKYQAANSELKIYDWGVALSGGVAKKFKSSNMFIELKAQKGFEDNISESFRNYNLMYFLNT